MSNKIHPSSIVEDGVKIGKNVEIGPFCWIKNGVIIGDNNVVTSHVVIQGNTKIGTGNKFFPFSNIGDVSQDLKFENEESLVEIGDNNDIREHVTIHAGTTLGNPHCERKNLTKVGSNNLLMVGVHIAHDCVVGDDNILANNVALAGHVSVGNSIIIGGLSAIQQFVRIGDYAIIVGMSGVESDVIPYALVKGERAYLAGLNLVGLRRKNFAREDISLLKKTIDEIFKLSDRDNFKEKIAKISKAHNKNTTIKLLTDFLKTNSKKAILKPKNA
jgi:UDP-N-acetylglucosamine acyltransferase